MDSSMRERLLKLSTTNVSDALDALGYKGSTYGVRPMYEGVGKIAGSAVTVKMTAAGETKGKVHLGIRAIEAAQPGGHRRCGQRRPPGHLLLGRHFGQRRPPQGHLRRGHRRGLP